MDALQCEIPSGIVYSNFRARWETSVEFKGLESFLLYKEADNTVFWALITEKEVEKNVKEMRRTSASGPHGLTVGHLAKLDPEYSLLSERFYLWLAFRTIPDALWKCRMVLILKSSDLDRLRDINNWRPITITSIVLRLFSRILTARLARAWPINPRQKWYICAAGCLENLKMLQLVVKHAKMEHQELGVMFVDTAKAFDTICHWHIIKV